MSSEAMTGETLLGSTERPFYLTESSETATSEFSTPFTDTVTVYWPAVSSTFRSKPSTRHLRLEGVALWGVQVVPSLISTVV